MGLDMFAYSVAAEDVLDGDEIAKDENGQWKTTELFYWRKHHDLHGWMNDLYRSRGGTEASFNCIPIRLYPEDLDALEKDVRENKLPRTTGFFFGDNPPNDDSIEEDLEFIEAARGAITDGHAVFYDSWW